MGTMASPITSLTIVYSTFIQAQIKKKHQSSVLLAFVRGIHRGPVNSPHKWPVTRKMFPFDDVIMSLMNGDAQIISIMDCCYWITRFAIHFLQEERSSRLLSIAALGAHCVLVFYSPINDKRAVVGYQKHNTGNDIFDIINVCCKRVVSSLGHINVPTRFVVSFK